MSRATKGAWWSVGFVGLYALIGVCLYVLAWVPIWDAHRSLSWPQTSGTVRRSSSNMTLMGEDNDRVYVVTIAYHYRVHEQSMEGLEHERFFDLFDAQELVEEYPENASVDVFFDPQESSHSVLHPGPTLGANNLFRFLVLPYLLLPIVGSIGFKLWQRVPSTSRRRRRGPSTSERPVGRGLASVANLRNPIPRLILLAILIFGVFGSWRRLGHIEAAAKASLSWPQVRGEIVRSTLHSYPSDETYAYEFTALYKYQVAGSEFDGDRVAFGYQGSDERSAVENLVARFGEGSEASVYYQPDNPGVAVLVPGSQYIRVRNRTWLLLAGVLLILFIVGLGRIDLS